MAEMTPAEAKEKAESLWQYRAIKATMGNQSRLGALIIAILGRHAAHPPWFGPSGVIDTEGFLITNMVDRRGDMHVGTRVGSVQEVNENLNRLADAINATDEERLDMFEHLRRWVVADFRAQALSARTLH